MYDGESIGQDAGQRFNAPFTAMLFVDYFDFTLDLQFLKESAYPFLRQTVDFIESYVTNSSDGKGGAYTAHIHHGCAQEMCPGQPANPGPGESKWQKQHYGDTTVDLAFFKLALRSAIRLSARLLVDTDKRRRWQALLDHLAPYTTTELPAFAGTYQDRPPADQDPRTVFALSKNYSVKVRWNTSQLTQFVRLQLLLNSILKIPLSCDERSTTIPHYSCLVSSPGMRLCTRRQCIQRQTRT
jgi:hypothetical protein